MSAARYVMLVPEGAAGQPMDDLDGLTPLEAARTPNLDALAGRGRVGMVATTPPGGVCSTESTLACLLGYDPLLHPLGRVRLDAFGLVPAGESPPLPDDRAAYRIDFITVDDAGLITPPPGALTLPETRTLLGELAAAVAEALDESPDIELRPLAPGVGVLLVDEPDDDDDRSETVCQPLGAAFGRPAKRQKPVGPHADLLTAVMEVSAEHLAGHELNDLRAEAGQPPISQVWIWGGGAAGALPDFSDMQRGVEGMLLGDEPGAVGLARQIGFSAEYRQTLTNADAARWAVDALDYADVVAVYLTAPAKASFAGDVEAAIAAIEAIDREVLPPILARLEQHERWRILVAPSLRIDMEQGAHVPEPVPFLLSGFGMAGVVERRFTEPQAAESDLLIEVGHELMEYFLYGAGMRNLDR